MSMDGLVAVVTGSSRGIGKGIAKIFGEQGARVAVVARSEEEGGRLNPRNRDTRRRIFRPWS